MNISILLLEDSSADAQVVRALLAAGDGAYRIDVVETLAQAVAKLEHREYDVILSDLTLPDAEGLEAVEGLRASAPRTPIVVQTSLDSSDAAIRALNYGAQDYVVKCEMNPQTLDRVLRHAIQRHRLWTQNQQLIEQRERDHRKLTGKNRRLRRLVNTAQKFVDNVSHEFRTPLTVIQEYSSLLRDGVVDIPPEEQQRFLDVVLDRAEDLNNMVNDMLDSSRMRAGLMGHDRDVVQVSQIVQRVCHGLERKAEVRNVTLELDVPDDLPDVFCDAEKAGRVIINLAVNAIKFSGDAGRVRITAGAREKTNDIVVSVSDNGPGMTPEQLTVIFKRFRQLKSEIKSSTKGFGLGLSIVRELVELNYGEVSVSSRPGHGSTFSFTLPMNDPQEITSRHIDRIARGKRGRPLSIIDARLPDSANEQSAREINGLWKFVQRKRDLTLRVGPRHWILLLPQDDRELDRFLKQIDATHAKLNRNRPHGELPAPSFMKAGCWQVPHDRNAVIQAVASLTGVSTRMKTDINPPHCLSLHCPEGVLS